jgi:hypothetical protein
MTPEIMKRNFVQVDEDEINKIILEKDKSEKARFIYQAFQGFIPLSFDHEGLVDVRNEDAEVYYQVVPLTTYDLFIGLLYNVTDKSVYIFNAKSCDEAPYLYVTLASVFHNSQFLTIKVLLNLMVESLLL